MTRGFTLLEVVAASAMAAMLMMVVMTVGVSIKRSEKRLGERAAQVPKHRDLRAMLEHDLVHAQAVQVLEDGAILIDGYGGLDRQTLDPTHRPTTVTYRVYELAGKPTLLREQVELDVASTDDGYVELVQTGVEKIELEPVRKERRTSGRRPGAVAPAEDGEDEEDPWSPLPEMAVLRIEWATAPGEAEVPPVEEMLLLR